MAVNTDDFVSMNYVSSNLGRKIERLEKLQRSLQKGESGETSKTNPEILIALQQIDAQILWLEDRLQK